MKKTKYRDISQFCVAEEVRKGNEVRILDKLIEKVYRAENMTAMEYINMIEDDNYSRYECWVVVIVDDDSKEDEE